MVNKTTDYVGSFAKGLQVIECFDAASPKLSITDVARKTGLDRATARRSLLTLHAENYAQYDGKYFWLTPKALRLGLSALASMPLAQIVQPWLDQLSDQIGQSSSVAILDGSEIVYIARAAQKRVMSIGLLPGSRLPAHVTSMGRVLLADLPKDQVEVLLEQVDLSPRTPKSLASKDDVFAELSRVRAQGYAFVDQEVEPGLRSIAVPIFNHNGKVVGALNTGFAVLSDEPQDAIEAYLPRLLKVQEALRREVLS